jgi:soluble lytic murein transglycosylase
MHDVRSPAGARGLMQLMPGTARETALDAGMRVATADLYQPEINITLGSRYLAGLLEEFNGNRALAAAAYNAGPNRVKQWLRRSADNPVPMDIWIETIPFLETRGYVQNVLAYSVIYGVRMGQPVPFLTPVEAAAIL